MRVRVENGRPVISAMAADGPAAAAGLKKGELLLAVDGQDVTSLGPGAISYLMSKPAGTKLNLTVASGTGEQRTVTLTVARP
jgi:C-terminal processing protease CtpA/Prc